jgi:ADP-ribosylglycohydrolase
MALALARSLLKRGEFDMTVVREAYRAWILSGPFDYGFTVSNALSDKFDPASQANGALMRVSPLGIFGALHDLEKVARWAQEDAAITHLNPICGDASALYAVAIAEAIRDGLPAREVYDRLVERAKAMGVDAALLWAIKQAETEPPRDYETHMGHVQIALHNALWELLYAKSLEEGVVETVLKGGDTDTNAAICGALLGSVYGRDAIPNQWEQTILNCRLAEGPGVHWPRPKEYWPTDALDLAAELVGL